MSETIHMEEINEEILDRVLEKANDFYGIPIGMEMGKFIIRTYHKRAVAKRKLVGG
jgi:hypothetical protein